MAAAHGASHHAQPHGQHFTLPGLWVQDLLLDTAEILKHAFAFVTSCLDNGNALLNRISAYLIFFFCYCDYYYLQSCQILEQYKQDKIKTRKKKEKTLAKLLGKEIFLIHIVIIRDREKTRSHLFPTSPLYVM